MQAPLEFKVVPNNILPGCQLVEISRNGVLLGTIGGGNNQDTLTVQSRFIAEEEISAEPFNIPTGRAIQVRMPLTG